MKSKIPQLFFLAVTLCLLSAVAATNAIEPKKAPAKRISCAGVMPFVYGQYYYAGFQVVWNGTLYYAYRDNQNQYPDGWYYWKSLGPCD